jgi:deoxyadenosine/deoxycytidine kinase
MSASTATLRSRIRRRGRAFEAGLTDGHLDGLSAAFSTAYAAWPGRLLTADADTFDVFDDLHVHDLSQAAHAALTLLEAS